MSGLNDVIQGILGGPVGVSGGLSQSPQYLGAPANNLHNAQNALASQANQHSLTWGAFTTASLPVLTISVAQTKITQQCHLLVSLLPVSIASRMHTCEFYREHNDEPARFVLTFDNMRTLVFTDIDLFPSDEHIARIALECP